MSQQSSLVMWSRRLLEFAWLLTIVLIPSYFNLLSSRHFEPDKAVVFRALVTMMMSLAAVVWVHMQTESHNAPTQQQWWQRIRSFPLGIAIFIYVVFFLFATITSIVPNVSWWGSYQRMQGTYTNLSYIAFTCILIFFVTSREQLMRILAAITISAVIPAAYGIVQHLELDPLPWKGDVITRVASTMGNSIFIAAYLILVLPIAIAFLVMHIKTARSHSAPSPSFAWQWLVGYTLAIIGGVVLVFSAMQFGGVVRAIDTRFWWVYPGSIVCAFAAFALPIWPVHKLAAPRVLVAIPALMTCVYALVTLLVSTASDGVQIITPATDRFGANWNLWLIAAVLLQLCAAGVCFTAPKNIETAPLLSWATVVATGVLVLLSITTIFFTQSRGPWIGGAVGLFVFITLLLFDIVQHSPRYAALAKKLIYIELAVFVAIVAFLLVFNFAKIPALEPLRATPYIGRMGKLFDVSPGTTGDVRMKIWFGDTHAGGALALVSADPLRSVIGWGPESMFVAYTPYYPPSLANVESRSASPDRSHQAFLDEVVNKGILGLLSYVAILITALALARQVQRRISTSTDIRVLMIASISIIVAHNVEGLTGIPIVATLLFFWIAIALIVIAHRITNAPQSEVVPAQPPEQPTSEPTPTATLAARRRKQTNVRTTQTTRRAASSDSFGLYAMSAVIIIVGMIISWSWNLDNALADMRFQQGQNYIDSSNSTGNTDQQIIGMTYFIDAIRMEPTQDIYYLNLGRSLLKFADIRRRQAPAPTRNEQTTSLPTLLQQTAPVDLQAFLQQRSPIEILRYAEATLRKAHDLNPRNKDHFANMARLYIFWYTRMEANPEILQSALTWFRDGMAVAPQDVTIINEYIEALLTYASTIQASDPATATSTITEAEQMLNRSLALDQRYRDTTLRQANVLRAKGDYAAAVDIYVSLVVKTPRILDAQITTLVEELRSYPDLLIKLRDAYNETMANQDTLTISIIGLMSSRLDDHENAIKAFRRLAELQPDSLEAQQNYTLVLSDAKEYESATLQAERLQSLAISKGITDTNLYPYTQLIEFLRTMASQP
ncbi:MAG: O-antigen ligase family protein [Roseiflexaceae bacterium]